MMLCLLKAIIHRTFPAYLQHLRESDGETLQELGPKDGGSCFVRDGGEIEPCVRFGDETELPTGSLQRADAAGGGVKRAADDGAIADQTHGNV